MNLFLALFLVSGCGLLGGIVNAFLAHEGFVWPRIEALPSGGTVWRPGFLGNALVGIVAGIVLTGMYTPVATIPIDTGALPPDLVRIQTLVGAIVSGIGGARLLTKELDSLSETATRRVLADSITKLAAGLTEKEMGK